MARTLVPDSQSLAAQRCPRCDSKLPVDHPQNNARVSVRRPPECAEPVLRDVAGSEARSWSAHDVVYFGPERHHPTTSPRLCNSDKTVPQEDPRRQETGLSRNGLALSQGRRSEILPTLALWMESSPAGVRPSSSRTHAGGAGLERPHRTAGRQSLSPRQAIISCPEYSSPPQSRSARHSGTVPSLSSLSDADILGESMSELTSSSVCSREARSCSDPAYQKDSPLGIDLDAEVHSSPIHDSALSSSKVLQRMYLSHGNNNSPEKETFVSPSVLKVVRSPLDYFTQVPYCYCACMVTGSSSASESSFNRAGSFGVLRLVYSCMPALEFFENM
jgi:hypothetical protein